MRRITIRRARTWHYRKMRPCIEQSNGPVSLSLSQSCPDCIINTSGYDFRKGQALDLTASSSEFVGMSHALGQQQSPQGIRIGREFVEGGRHSKIESYPQRFVALPM